MNTHLNEWDRNTWSSLDRLSAALSVGIVLAIVAMLWATF